MYRYANIIRSYRTVPHVDQAETERITASLLVDSIRQRNKIRPAQIRLPLLIGGDSAVGSAEPMKSIFRKLEEIEKTPGIATASFFVGFAWADTPHTSSSVIVVPEAQSYESIAQEKAAELAAFVFAKKEEFAFDAVALSPEQAVKNALESFERPVYISDTGDNTTGGAPGTSTVLLKNVLNYREQTSSLAAGIKMMKISTKHDESVGG